MPIINMAVVDTTPGASGNNPFTPPAGWGGDKEDYKLFVRSQFNNIENKQRMMVQARLYKKGLVKTEGMFTSVVIASLEFLANQ